MCVTNCRDTSEPSEIPSSTSTVWVRIGGTVSGRPAIAAAPTAIMAPEISPPGRFAHKNSAPPAAPITSVSSTLRVLVRLGMANAIGAGIWLTAPYGKSPHRGQMRQRTCSNARSGTALHASSVLPREGGISGIRYRGVLRCGLTDIRRACHRARPEARPDADAMQYSGCSDHFALAAAAFLHSDMNFLRSLPWTPLVSASVEHSSDAAVRGFSAFLSAGAIFAAVAGVAGAVVCANAGLIRSREAKAGGAAREEIVIMGNPSD